MEDTQHILNKVRSGKKERDEVITKLYRDQKLRQVIANYVLNRGGSATDVSSILNLSLVQFIKTVIKNPELKITNSISHFIFGIARHRWIDELERSQKVKASELKEYHKEIIDDQKADDLVINFERKELLRELLDQLRSKCKEVLMYWANGYSMEEIAKMLDYKSFKMAKKKRYDCFKELMNFLSKNPHVKAALA